MKSSVKGAKKARLGEPADAGAATAKPKKTFQYSYWLPPILVAVVTALVFSPVLQNDFVNWDDHKNFVDNLDYRGLSWSNIRWMFTTFHMGHYQPLSWVTLGLDYVLWGMNPLGYHLTNLILHAANALLFYWLALRLFSLPTLESLAKARTALPWAAAFSALLFSIHPLRVESVAWATERRDVLAGFFLLLTVLFYLKAVKAGEGDFRYRRNLALSLVVYLLSLLSKASGMTLPLVLLVLDVFPLRRIDPGSKAWFSPGARKLWLQKLPYLLFAVIAVIVAFAAQYQAAAYRPLEQHGLPSRMVQVSYAFAFYLWKTVLPFNLSPLYELPVDPAVWRWTFLFAGFFGVAITALLLAKRQSWPALLAAWVIYGALLAPTSGIAQSGPQLVADRYSYFSCMSWAILAGGGLLYLRQMARETNFTEVLSAVGWSLGLTVPVVLGILSWNQTKIWRDSQTLWRHAIALDTNSFFAHNNLGEALSREGRLVEATVEFRAGLRLKPKDPDSHYNLGNALAKQGKLDEAKPHFRNALRLDPDHADSHYDLGNLLARQGQLEEAAKHFHQVLRVAPQDARAHYNLGQVLARQGRTMEAIDRFRRAVGIDPKHGKAIYHLAVSLAAQGEWAEAGELFQAALQMNPGSAEAHSGLARVFTAQGKKKEAIYHYEEALRIMKSRSQSAPTP